MSIAEDTIYDQDDLCEHDKIVCCECEEDLVYEAKNTLTAPSRKGGEDADLAANLSGRELDAAVAERVMGWIPDNIISGDTAIWQGWLMPNGKRNAPPHSFSSDISFAMEVVEKMHLLGFRVQITNPLTPGTRASDNIRHWYVSFDANCDETAGEAGSLPEAICFAALRAIDTNTASGTT